MFIKNNKGFSLIEILVTIGIVAVLGSIAIPAYNQYKDNANETAVKIDVGNSQKAYLAKDAVDGSFCHQLSSVGLSNVGTSDIYSKADEAFFGFSSTTCSAPVTTTNIKADIKKPDGTTSVPVFGSSNACAISSSSFTLGGGFKKGTTSVGYFINNEAAGPSSTSIPGTCSQKVAGTGTCGTTVKSVCVGNPDCEWTSSAITNLCA